MEHLEGNFNVNVPVTMYNLCSSCPDAEMLEDDDEISPDLWQEACWIVIRYYYIIYN